jgi:translocation and assembly module TamB
MKSLLLYGPFLWLRKVLLYLLGTFIVLATLVYFIANSPWVIKKAADMFAPDYNITYSRIHGNVLTGVEIENLSYANKSLAKHITLKWNPNGLVQKKIIVNNVLINHLNVDTIKDLVNSFPSDDNESSEPFAFSVNVKKLSVDIDSFVEEGILINNVVLNGEKIYYASDVISVKKLGLAVDSNITKILLKASISDGKVEVENLRIDDVDTLALQNLFMSDTNESHVEKEEDDNNTQEVSNPLIPTMLVIHNLETNILARDYEPVKLEKMTLRVKDTSINLQTLILEKGFVDLNATSNLSNLTYSGKIKENKLLGQVKVTPQESLFTLYNLPLRRKSVGDVHIDLDASQERVTAKIDTQMLQLLEADKDAFNLDIESLKSVVTYTIKDAKLKAESTATLSTPYGKDILITNLFTLDNNISYSGDISLAQVLGVNAKYVKPLNNLKLRYVGTDEGIKVKILSKMLEGKFDSLDFKNADLDIESKEALLLRDFVLLPKELNQTKIDIKIHSGVSFDANASYVVNIKLNSNVVNVDANVSYKDKLVLTSRVDIPKESLLRPYSKELKWDQLNPLTLKANLTDADANVDVMSKSLKVNAHYDLNTTRVDGKILLGGLSAHISGIAEKKIKIDSKINSMPLLLKSIGDIYTLGKLPKVDGSAVLSLEIDELKTASLMLKSPHIAYHSDHKTVHDLRNIDLLVSMDAKKVQLKHYSITYDKEKIFATKPSLISLEKNIVKIEPLWVNDQLKAEGSYDLKTKKGKIVAAAKLLHISHEIIDLDSNIDVTAVLDNNKTSIDGKIILLGGDIHYDMSQKSFASDSDIVIVQDITEEKTSPFMDNLSVALQVETKKPLVYNKDAINIKAKVDLGVHKAEHAELLVLGSVEILKGGTYIFQDKKFVLDKSFVHFTGNPNKPLLEISVKYRSLNHIVTISITGSADMPNIAFSSKPSLSKEQILSLILFDTEEGSGTNSGDDMMKMMGGAMAKSALSDLGIKLDHLVLGEGNSVEVGKKLTKKITIIYVNDIVSSVKLKYQHGKRTESVIGVSEESQSYDIVYKRDF